MPYLCGCLTQRTCTHTHREDPEDFILKDPPLFNVKACSNTLAYTTFPGKSFHKFQGKRLYSDSYFHSSAFKWFRKSIPSRTSSFEVCALTTCLCMLPSLLTHTATSSPFQESKISSLHSFSLPLSGPLGCSAVGLLLPSRASQALEFVLVCF